MSFETLLLALVVAGAGLEARADALARFSMPLEKMRAFTAACVKVPDVGHMEKELTRWEENQRSISKSLSFTIDGFPFAGVTDQDFLAVRTLTIPRGAHGSLKEQYRFSMAVEKKVAHIERACISPACGASHEKERRFDLRSFFKTSEGVCTSALCGLKRIFGASQGSMILWSFVKFGANLSPLSDPMADPQGLDVETLQAIIGAASLTPEHLRPFALKDGGFFRYRKGRSLPFYKGQKVVANSFGGVFDPIDELNYQQKVYFFVHELAHRARLRAKPALDESPEWMKVSGWNDGKAAPAVTREISLYAQTNPFEDFAETYALYRLDPSRLKALSLARYEYMRDRVFDGIEYTQDLCTGAKGLTQARQE